MVWTILGVCILCGGGLVMLFSMRRAGERTIAAAEEEFRGPADEEVAEQEWVGALPQELAEKFTSSMDPRAKVSMVIKPGEMEPHVLEFFREGEGSREVVKHLSKPLGFTTSTGVYEGFQVEFENAPPRLLSVLITEEGGKIDFKSYARWNSVPWREIVAGNVEKVDELRVRVTLGNYYAYQYADDAEWIHLIASVEDDDETLDLYARRDSPYAQVIGLHLSERKKGFTISAKVADGPRGKPILELDRVLAIGWNERVDPPAEDPAR